MAWSPIADGDDGIQERLFVVLGVVVVVRERLRISRRSQVILHEYDGINVPSTAQPISGISELYNEST